MLDKWKKKFVRQSHKTKDEHQAVDLVEKFYGIAHRVRSDEKIFVKPVNEAIQRFLAHKRSQIGVGDGNTEGDTNIDRVINNDAKLRVG